MGLDESEAEDENEDENDDDDGGDESAVLLPGSLEGVVKVGIVPCVSPSIRKRDDENDENNDEDDGKRQWDGNQA